MLNIVKPGFHFNFSRYFTTMMALSLVLIISSLYLIGKGLNFGVDFKGGAEVLIRLNPPVPLEKFRQDLSTNYKSSFLVQSYGDLSNPSEVLFLVKIPASSENLNEVTATLTSQLESLYPSQGVVERVDIVGPKAGSELRLSGILAMFWAILAIMVYIGLRFDVKYAPGAIVALIHDVLIVLGLFALLEIEFTLQIVAALLAVIGYSVNDTVIVFDRVRENEQKSPGTPLSSLIDKGASETFSRTLLTSGTTLAVCIIMMIWGGESLKDFFLALTLGIIVGTYSSLFIASPVTMLFAKITKK